ncbi:MAG: OmpA family protein [Tropicimonas sp.]|uniref:OmpA family protein n=1 Tax=Tropicimonas sp. TaxID=2067044 RepID=UPI003A89854C
MRLLPALFALVFSILPFSLKAQDVGTVNFAFDSATLDAEASAKVTEIAELLKEKAGYRATVVVGHTDAVGSQGYNQGLGMRRAQAVAAALNAAGAPVSRIGTVESRGENELLVRVSGPERRNRRVTVTLEEIMEACRSWRQVSLSEASIGPALQGDLQTRLGEAVAWYARLEGNGQNGAAFQMAGAAREDCGNAVGFDGGASRKLEYAQRCLCSSARLRTATGAN